MRAKPLVHALQRTRKFELQIVLSPRNDAVIDVLSTVESDRLAVFDENNSATMQEMFDSKEDTVLRPTGTRTASIRRWLAGGCQLIRWDVGDELADSKRKCRAIARYQHNAADVIYPEGADHIPPGPSAFVGQIIISREMFRLKEGEEIAKQLRFVIAHELTHVFNMLRFLVPAFRNWRRCWRNVLGDGAGCGVAKMFQIYQSHLVDDYGSENELESIRDYWPSQAEDWFKSLRRNQPQVTLGQ